MGTFAQKGTEKDWMPISPPGSNYMLYIRQAGEGLTVRIDMEPDFLAEIENHSKSQGMSVSQYLESLITLAEGLSHLPCTEETKSIIHNP